MKPLDQLFVYVKQTFPEDCLFNISPSRIEQFFNYPKLWYQETMLGQDKAFKGNTGSVTGTIVHYLGECAVNKQPITREEINKELILYDSNNKDLNLDIPLILSDYPVVAEKLINEYILPNNAKGAIIKSEVPVCVSLGDGIYLGGTCDRLEGDCVVDYKIVATKPNENIIPFGYKIQTLAYAYALRKLGYEINRIRIVYCVKPTKTLPTRLFVVTESIDCIAEKLVHDTLLLIKESILYTHTHPELAYLIFKSYDLKKEI